MKRCDFCCERKPITRAVIVAASIVIACRACEADLEELEIARKTTLPLPFEASEAP